MNTSAKTIEQGITDVATFMLWLKFEASNIEKLYFAAGVNTQIDGLSTGSTPATVSTKLTKDEFISGITLCQQITKFFTNEAVTQADYLQTCEQLIFGSVAASVVLSDDAENIGERLKVLSSNLISNFKRCGDILTFYTVSEISDIISSISDSTIMFGGIRSKADFASGITLIEQMKKMINNEAVATGDYQVTVAKWAV